MKIFRLLNHVARENTYLLVNDQGIIVVDPGSDVDHIQEKIASFDKPVVAILITHAHYDHIMGLDVIRDAFDTHLFTFLIKKRLGFIRRKIIFQVWSAMRICQMLS
jgi:glyoxylase-like metal-dependent hydrolase (beta-lactamase superfamily II)